MAVALAQNKTLQDLELIVEWDLTQYPGVKQFITHLFLGVSRNTNLKGVMLYFPPWISGSIKRELMLCLSLDPLVFHNLVVNSCMPVSVTLAFQLL